jgi:predicted nucleotidyltransferase
MTRTNGEAIGGLPIRTLNEIASLLGAHSGIKKAVLYGSRAKGNYRTGSDIDIALFTDETFCFRDLSRLTGEFDDSSMPYFVDVCVYDKLTSTDLKAHIDRVGQALWERQ